jgi:hypothetical protein
METDITMSIAYPLTLLLVVGCSPPASIP